MNPDKTATDTAPEIDTDENQSGSARIHEVAAAHVALLDKQAELSAALKALGEEIKASENRILDQFADEGIPRVTVRCSGGGTATLFPRSQIWARRNPDVDEATFLAAITAAGLPDLIKQSVNVMSLSAYVREQARANNLEDGASSQILAALHESLATSVKVDTAVNLGIRRSG